MCTPSQRGHHVLIVGIEKQTVAFNIKARVDFKNRKRDRMSIWQAMEMLNTYVDDSDPDVSTSLKAFPSALTSMIDQPISD